MTVNAQPPDPARPVTLAHLLNLLRDQSPFLDNRVTGSEESRYDVEAIHRGLFDRLTSLAKQACTTGRGLGAILWGEAGTGKSQLLARLARWANYGEKACLVYLHNLQASPGNLPRTILRATLSALTHAPGRGMAGTLLFRNLHKAIQLAFVGAGGKYHWSTLEKALRQQLEAHSLPTAADAALSDRTVHSILFQLYRSIHRTTQRKENGTLAALAAQWLRGDVLSATQAEQLGLLPPRPPATGVGLEDNQQIQQVMVALTAVSAAVKQPFILCLDQVDTLEDSQVQALTRFLEALLDASRNLLVVTAGNQESLQGLLERRVIGEAAWDRLGQFRLLVDLLSLEQARELVQKRLHSFLGTFEQLPLVRQMMSEDPLFPLGRAWFDRLAGNRKEIRPREILNEAREAWELEQESLRTLGYEFWLAGWRNRQTGEPLRAKITVLRIPDEQIWETIDRFVEDRMADYEKHAAFVLPHPDSVCESVAQLLAHCRDLVADYDLLSVERADKSRSSQPATYNLVVRQRGAVEGTEIRTGIVFVPANNSGATFHILDRLREDPAPPQRILLVTHQNALDLGSKGEAYLNQLQARPNCHLRVLSLPQADFATLDALHAVWNLAKSEDLEIRLPDGQVRSLTASEVEGSHHRRNRYRAAPVLAALFNIPPGVMAVASPQGGTTEAIPTPRTLEEFFLGDEESSTGK